MFVYGTIFSAGPNRKQGRLLASGIEPRSIHAIPPWHLATKSLGHPVSLGGMLAFHNPKEIQPRVLRNHWIPSLDLVSMSVANQNGI